MLLVHCCFTEALVWRLPMKSFANFCYRAQALLFKRSLYSIFGVWLKVLASRAQSIVTKPWNLCTLQMQLKRGTNGRHRKWQKELPTGKTKLQKPRWRFQAVELYTSRKNPSLSARLSTWMQTRYRSLDLNWLQMQSIEGKNAYASSYETR